VQQTHAEVILVEHLFIKAMAVKHVIETLLMQLQVLLKDMNQCNKEIDMIISFPIISYILIGTL
jgi:hypothetical protein